MGYRYDEEPKKISDYKIAQAVEGIDLIIGGHTHTFLDKPEEVSHPSGHITLINQVGWAGIRLGKVDFVFEKGKKKSSKNTSYAIK